MKKLLQGFGIGLFLAGAVITLLSQFTDFEQSKDDNEVAQLKKQLLAAEQEIATLNEAVAQASVPAETDSKDRTKEVENSESASNEQNEEKQTNSKSTIQNNTATVTGTILIYEGVSLYDIGKQAEDQGIVQNGRELELYLSKPEYARSIQKGQFDLNSDMSLNEMARILTGKQ